MKHKTINLDNIIETLNDVSDIDIRNITRKREYCDCRALYYHIATTYTIKTYDEITKRVNKNHCALINSRKTLAYVLKSEPYKSIHETTLEMLKLQKLPEYIVTHLKQYSDAELLEVYETRLKPFKRMLDAKQ